MERSEPVATDGSGWGVRATLALSMALASLGTSIANIALPSLAEAFGVPFGQVQGVVVAYLAALTVSVVIAGRLGDVYGLKRMHLAGLGLFAVASLLCGMADDLWLLIGARALQGIGAAFLMTMSMALMRATAGSAQVGRAMGLLGTVSALGTALGPSLGGLLIPATGWSGVFWVQAPPAVLALLLGFAVLPHGTSKRKAPSARWSTLLNGRLAASLLVNLLVAAVMMTTLVVGPFYLDLVVGLKEALVGLVMSVGPVVSLLSGIPSGRLVDAWGTRRGLAIGLVLLTAGAFLLAILPAMLGVGGYVLAIIVLTPGYQLFQAANNTAALADIPTHQRGTVSGLLNLSRNIGLTAGASIMAAVFAFGVGGAGLADTAPVAVAAGMQLTFLLGGGLMIVALAIAFGHLPGRSRRG